MPVCDESKILAQKKWTGFIQPMEKRKTGGWLHPAHGEKKNGLVASSPRRKEKWGGCIQPMEKRIMGWLHQAHGEKKNGVVASSPWRKRKMGCLHPAHGAKDHLEEEKWTGFEKRRKGRRSIGDIRTGKKLQEFAGKCVYLSQSLV